MYIFISISCSKPNYIHLPGLVLGSRTCLKCNEGHWRRGSGMETALQGVSCRSNLIRGLGLLRLLTFWSAGSSFDLRRQRFTLCVLYNEILSWGTVWGRFNYVFEQGCCWLFFNPIDFLLPRGASNPRWKLIAGQHLSIDERIVWCLTIIIVTLGSVLYSVTSLALGQ